MADRYLLETSATDGYQKEDASGVLSLEVFAENENDNGDSSWWAGTMRSMVSVGLAAGLAVGASQTMVAQELVLTAHQDEGILPPPPTLAGPGGRPIGIVWPQQQVIPSGWRFDGDDVVTAIAPTVDDGDTWQSGVAPTYGWAVPQPPLAQGDLCVQNTRFYFSWFTPPQGNVAPGYAGWTDLGLASHNRMSPTVDTWDVAAIPAFSGGAQSANDTAIVRQLVSDSLAAGIVFRTVDTIRSLANVLETASTANLNRLPICLKVYAADAVTLQATLLPLGWYGPTSTEIGTSSEIRFLADGVPLQANYTTVNGDRLVFELGMQVDGTGSSVCQGQVSVGSKAQADLPAYETAAGSTLNPWLDISRTITFFDPIEVGQTAWESHVAPTWGWPAPRAFTDTDDAPIPTPAALVADEGWVNAVAPTWGWPTPRAQTEEGDLAVTAPVGGNALDDGQGQFRLLQRGRPMQLRVGRVLQGGSGAPPPPVLAPPEEDYWQSPATQIALNANLLASEPTWLLDASESVPAGLDENYWTSGVKPTWGWWVANAFPDNSELTVTLGSPLHADDTAAWGLLGFRQAWGWPVPQAKIDTEDAPPQSPAALVHDGVPWDSGVRPSWGWATPKAVWTDDDIAYIPVHIEESDWSPPAPWSRAWLAPLFATEQEQAVRSAPPEEDYWFSGVAPVSEWHTDVRLWRFAVDEVPVASIRNLASMLRVTGLIANASELRHQPALPTARNFQSRLLRIRPIVGGSL